MTAGKKVELDQDQQKLVEHVNQIVNDFIENSSEEDWREGSIKASELNNK